MPKANVTKLYHATFADDLTAARVARKLPGASLSRSFGLGPAILVIQATELPVIEGAISVVEYQEQPAAEISEAGVPAILIPEDASSGEVGRGEPDAGVVEEGN